MDQLKQRIAALSPAQRALLELRLTQTAKEGTDVTPPITRVSRNGELPLSFAQQRLWFLHQLHPDSAFYNVPRLLRIRGALKVDIMREALNAFVQRHEAVRTVFPSVNGRPFQKIMAELEMDLPVVDISKVAPERRENGMLRLATVEAKRTFDLACGPLFRACVFRMAENDHVLLINTHHIISDERTAGVLYEDLSALYAAILEGRPPSLPELAVQYVDYAVWQRERLKGSVLEKQLNYWRKQLDGAPEVLEWPTDRPRPAVQSFRGSVECRTLPPYLRDALKELSRREQATSFMTLLAAFSVLLHHYSRQEDVVVGTVITNRNQEETQRLVGFFLNTLPLRIDLSGNPTFQELLVRVREMALGAYAHQDLPFEKLVEELHPEHSLSHNPLFQLIFTNRTVTRPAFEVAGLHIQPLDVPTDTSKFDVSAFVGEEADGLSVAIEYNTDLFDQDTIQRMLGHFNTVLEAIVAAPDRRIAEILILPQDEHQLVVRDWNDTGRSYPLTCVHEMFELQAARTPASTAVLWQDRSLTYGELNRKANQLAHYLRGQNVGPGSLVGICMERSPEMIIAVMGTLKAGAAYVPLDPDYPKERLAVMLDNSAAVVLLTQQHLTTRLPSNHSALVCLDTNWTDIAGHREHTPESGVTLDDLAYVIFTSGSTGGPKGVCLPHCALSNLLFWQFENSKMAAGTRTLQFTSLSFDVSFQEIFSTLCTGGTLVLISDSMRRDAASMLSYLREHQINRLFAPFVALQNLAEAARNESLLPTNLYEVITAGEQLQITPQITDLFCRLPECELHNHYGPSESHVVTAYRLAPSRWEWPALPPIGKPISNTQIYILDSRLQPVPIGVSGELYIGGLALATGYLKRPDLTQERFLPNPFSSDSSSRLYRTGDLARHRPDGNIDYLGRADDQVKIRGHRIEPGEIEAALREHPAVAASAVTPREQQGSKYLAAYVVPHATCPDAASRQSLFSELRGYLRERLPEYMVPAAFVVMERLPLTPSGKINRRVLPEPDLTALGTAYAAPRTAVEELLVAVWAGVLGREKIGIHDNFFDLGGHSLLATQVISRIARSLDLQIPLRTLFERPTVAELAQYLESEGRGQQDETPPIVPVAREGNLPLSFAQQRLWLLSQLVDASSIYNAPQVLRIRGPLQPEVLGQSINEVVCRHEVLRTTYHLAGDQPVQVIAANTTIALPVKDLSHLPEEKREAEAKRLVEEEVRRPFNLECGPVLRALLLRMGAEDHVLVVTFHHIVADGWSISVFDREVAVIYEALADGRPLPLPPLLVQYADYAVWQRNWMRGEILEKHIGFWRNHLAGAPPMVAVPTDRPRPQTASFEGGRRQATVPTALVNELKALSRREGATLFMTMLAAFQILLARWSQQLDLVVGTVVANRTRVETENLVGCLMNFLPLRTILREEDSALQVLHQVKKTVMQAYAQQDCPFEKLIEEINPQRVSSGNSVYNIVFLLQNFPEIAFSNRTLQARPMLVGLEAAHMDLRFAAGETRDGMWFICDYRRDLFQPGTIEQLVASYFSILEQVVQQPQASVSAFQLTAPLMTQVEHARARDQKVTIAVSATFTADPLEESLKFWMRELETAGEIQFAPYSQVFQQLLDPASIFSINRSGLNVVLVRLEDWCQDTGKDNFKLGEPVPMASRAQRNLEDLLVALQEAAQNTKVPYLLCMCPASLKVKENLTLWQCFDTLEREIAEKLSTSRGIYVVTSAELAAAYPVADYEDQQANALGHIPYRQEFFNALGTMIARRFYRIQTPPHKVIALDCDQTLWKGVCGEDGALGVNIDSACRALQEFVTAQRDAGMLVCLCSKNNHADVWKVFRQNPGMLLKQEHIVASRINWQPKSENLRSLAEELQVGLDSFIFLDDNPIECAEVEARCPEVLTLQLPETEPERSKFLRHIWAFDHLKVTEEDRQRSDFYAQNTQRDLLQRRSLSLDEFLAGLGLQVEIGPLQEADVVRVAQLTQRTNQFNFTTIRRTEAEIEKLVHSGAECLTVTLRDRFGEYGLVGAIIFQVHSDALETDTVLLSCRALGRRVEHRMLAHLGRIAQQRGIERIQLRFAPTEKNQPAREFLESLDAVLENRHGHGLVWDAPASRFAELSPQPCAADGVRSRSATAVPAFPVPAEESDAGVRTE